MIRKRLESFANYCNEYLDNYVDQRRRANMNMDADFAFFQVKICRDQTYPDPSKISGFCAQRMHQPQYPFQQELSNYLM